MKMRKMVSSLRIFCLLIIGLILTIGLGSKIGYAETYQYTIEAGSYEIVDAGDGYQEIKMEGFGQLLEPGKPKLPSKIFHIAIPPGIKVDSVEVVGAGLTELPGTYNIVPAPMVSPLSATAEEIEKARVEYNEIVRRAYSSDQPYPAETGRFITQGAYRKYNLAQVRYSPFYYRAKSGRLYFYPALQVTITYSYSAAISTEAEKMASDYVPEAEEKAKKFIINYEDAQKWYPAPDKGSISTTGGFVIVTTNALKDSVWPIKNWETCKGRAVYVETVENINANYSGVDLAEKIRNFLRAKLTPWGILKVLLVGNITDVPMRYTYPVGPDGYDDDDRDGDPFDPDEIPWELEDRVPTDYYYAELSLPDNQSWNSNGDAMYGQQGVDNVQFPNEVDVGRIPWSDPDIVEDICMKMVEFEYSNDMTFKSSILMPAAFFWSDTDNAELMEEILDIPHMSGWNYYRLYEDNSYYDSTYPSEAILTHTNVLNEWTSSNHYGFVNWAGHGSSTSAAYACGCDWCPCWDFIRASDCTSLNDDYPAIIFADSCSNSYPEVQSIGRRMLKQGAVAFVGATRVAMGAHDWNDPDDGSSQSLDYWFTYRVTNRLNSVGWAFHTFALQKMYTDYNWDTSWWEMFEWNLYSNPDLWLRDRPTALPNLTDTTPSGWSYPIVPRSANNSTDTWCPLSSTLPGNSNSTYYNWTWTNNGSYRAPGHLTRLYLDGVYVWWSTISWMDPGYEVKFINNGPNYVRGGRHTLYYSIDYNDEVWETNETDNCWGHQFVWSPYALPDDSPRTRSAPPVKNAWGCAPAPWYNNDGFSFVVQQEHPNKWWSAVGILPANSASDYDLRLWDIGDYTGSEGGFGSGYLEWSSYGGDVSDFVIVNDNTAPAGTYYAGVINYNEGTADFRIEEDTSVKIFEGTNGPYSKSSHNVLDIYECYLFEGEYGFKLVQISGNCDLGMSLYDDETVHCKKSEYMPGGYANNTGDGGDEFFKVDIPDAGFHGLVVWKVDSSDYNKSCTYKIKMGKCANPTTPSNPNPADGATDVSIYTNLDWADCANTDHYEVWLKKEGESWQKLGETEESEWDISGSLEYETTYTWTIKAVNICNNYTWSPYWTFTTSAEPKPELVVTSIHTSPVYPEPGQTVNIQVTIKNQGDLDAGAFYTSFYKHRTSPPGVGEAGDLNWTLSSLTAGAYHTFNGTVRYSDIDCYQMYAQVDTYNDVKEGNETNNVYGPRNIIVGRCYGDFDNDGNVDKDDLAVFAAAFGSVYPDLNYDKRCDFDYDGDVDGLDLAVFTADYGRTDCPVCP